MTDQVLTAHERCQLVTLVGRTHDARLLRRAYSLLWLDDGERITDIAAHWQMSQRSIYNWRERFSERNGQTIADRLADGLRPGRPRTVCGIIDPLVESVIEQAPSTFGYRTTVWTAPLLVRYLCDVQHLDVSVASVRLALARLRFRWKRPRHHLALRPVYWRQAKGGLNTASLSARAPSH